ncbi:MAG: hypothetical protein KDA31_05105 [Phycisphaerales bacterium]|nr:hypothetical protein [Phycisphaerales bacterium]
MQPSRTGRWVLWGCVLVSLLIHGVGLLSLADPESALAQLLLTPPDEEEIPKVTLGIDDSRHVSIAWIGFNQETPHSGVKSDTLQPQLSPEAASAAARAAEQAAMSASQLSESMLTRISELSKLAAKLEAARQAAERAKAAEKPADAEEPAQAESSEPTQDAIPDDRESDATTTEIAVRQNDLGQVVARQGLRIQTYRPQFDATTKQLELRTRRGGVTAVIRFAKNGSVYTASIKPGTATGVDSIDQPILDSVYRWKASGSDLDALPSTPDATITVEIQILF